MYVFYGVDLVYVMCFVSVWYSFVCVCGDGMLVVLSMCMCFMMFSECMLCVLLVLDIGICEC